MMQQTIWPARTSDDRTKYQRKSAVAVPRASCCGNPSRSSRSRTVMKTAEAVRNLRKRESIGRCLAQSTACGMKRIRPERHYHLEMEPIRLCSPTVRLVSDITTGGEA